MGKKKAIALALVAAFSVPLFTIADVQAQAPAKSKQAIAARQAHKGSAKKPVKKAPHRKTAKRKS